MKTLVLIRHAKSSKKSKKEKDFDRPLRKRGKNDGPLMGKVLRQMELAPDIIISSPAARALATAQLIAGQVGYDQNRIITDPNLYLEPKSKLKSVIMQADDHANTIFVVGHNPGLTDLANILSNESVDNIPTSGVCGIRFECDSWTEIDKAKGSRLFFEVPKQHRKKAEKREKQVF